MTGDKGSPRLFFEVVLDSVPVLESTLAITGLLLGQKGWDWDLCLPIPFLPARKDSGHYFSFVPEFQLSLILLPKRTDVFFLPSTQIPMNL